MNKTKKMKYWLLIVLIAVVQSVSAQQYHDAAAFDAYGNVKWILTDVGLLYFNEDGRLDKSKSTALSDYEKYQIERDVTGYVKQITTDFETIHFAYDAEHKLTKKTVRGSGKYSTTYERDTENKYQTEVTRMLSGRQENTAIKFRIYDDGENWICKSVKEGGESKKEKRVVGYRFDMSNYVIEDASKAMSLIDILDNPGMLQIDIFKYKARELNKMLTAKGIKGGISYKEFYKTKDYHGMPIDPSILASSSKEFPIYYKCYVHPFTRHKSSTYTLTLMVDELLAKNLPLKVIARFGTYGMSQQVREEYGVSFKYNSYPCEVINQIKWITNKGEKRDVSQLEIGMYKSEEEILPR